MPRVQRKFGSKITFRLPDDLHEKLKQAAEEDERTLNGQLIYIIRSAINQRGIAQPRAA